MEENELLLAFYGDDFTGSTDAMEALAINGYRTVLFLEPPNVDMLKRFEGISCIGVAGTSRAKSPADMEEELRPVFKSFAETEVKVVHYKTCSTFDSAPEVGSIGKAIELAREYFDEQKVIPLLIGAPPLGRYTIFGQHFARMHDTVYRLDRHPVMSRHPITPMLEADLRLHLAKQTSESIGLMNILELEGSIEAVRERYKQKSSEPGVLLFDVLDEERLRVSGQLIWESAEDGRSFVVGSSGLGYALTAHWKNDDVSARMTKLSESVPARNQVFAVSGSASMVTQQQIEEALEDGFYGIKIKPEQIVNTESLPRELLNQVIKLIKEGENVILYTAMGPEDPAILETRELFQQLGIPEFQSGELIGRQLGKWIREVVEASDIRRVIIAGGDTSGFATREIGVYGLETLLPISPGAPLCKAYSDDSRFDGIELALKGGQLGGRNYFTNVRKASSEPKQVSLG
ncbi:MULTISPECIES: four-carbon acid sugar kinase family protein [Bacillaceae]|uniref:four-carbon acid sugar kinase family protein n=1 Tax=Bacillaceae TaxID=186817 RepID=UPI00118C59BD|nr:four-carbon acid sugar kinase family protein [Bacillus sp. S3]QCJ44435.1 four-carbon acid sugar kinase family protein [Bacillus sp. S3]